MYTSTIAFLIIAFVLAILIVYFQYFFRVKTRPINNFLAGLRFISVLSILVLLVNPKFEQRIVEIVKPKLLVTADNSSSIIFADLDSILSSWIDKIRIDDELNEKFDLNYFSFGGNLQVNETLRFDKSRTNIFEAVKSLNAFSKQDIAAIVLLTDGNQTFGNDYKYFASKQQILPIIFGDTTELKDLVIDKINVNSFSFLNNNFPVEVFLRYNGKGELNSKFMVKQSDSIVYQQAINLSEDKKSQRLQFNLNSNKLGKHLYKTSLLPFKGEKNTINNYKNFSVDVIDEQTNIGLIYDVLHPDIGAIKNSIETNQQRKVHLINVNKLDSLKEDMGLYISYQPTEKFERLLNEIQASNKNNLIISGTQTDWNYLNSSQSNFRKQIINRTEAYFPQFNRDFKEFHIDDIGFDDLPPLEGYFGEITMIGPHEILLKQSINGIEINSPLLSVYSSPSDNKRGAILFGENIWKWRMHSFGIDQSFREFDQFFNSIIQYLTLASNSNPIELDYNTFYYTDEPIIIEAKVYDANFNFDLNRQLELNLGDEENKRPFYLGLNNYKIKLDNLPSGSYSFNVREPESGNVVLGTFSVLDYSIEQEKLGSNDADLTLLASNNKGKLFYPNQFSDFKNFLLQSKENVAIQKEKIKTSSLIDWKWLLGIIIVSLSLEWFLRKYNGLI